MDFRQSISANRCRTRKEARRANPVPGSGTRNRRGQGARPFRHGQGELSYPMRVPAVFICALFLASCGSDSSDVDTGTTITSTSGKVTLGVNQYLWHASLDTLRFMPLQSA